MKARLKGFTLVEILVVIAILGILLAVLVPNLTSAPKEAEMRKCRNVVEDAAKALEVIYFENDGIWPASLAKNSNTENGLDAEAGYALAKKGMSLSSDSDTRKLTGHDRFGLVTPWAMKTIKSRKAGSVNEGTGVKGGGTIRDHRLRYALCGENGSVIGADVGGESVNVRAAAAVWCCGPDGVILPYSKGKDGKNAYSWDYGKTQNVEK